MASRRRRLTVTVEGPEIAVDSLEAGLRNATHILLQPNTIFPGYNLDLVTYGSTEVKENLLQAFREMVTAFQGGYHPDTTEYAEYPEGYDQQRVDEITDALAKAGVNTYSEALRVTQEALS